jgi:hypothetical protein
VLDRIDAENKAFVAQLQTPEFRKRVEAFFAARSQGA